MVYLCGLPVRKIISMSGVILMADSKEYIKSSDEKGSINISEDVVAVIAAAAAVEVEGVQGLFHAYGKDLTNMLKKGLSRGIKLSIDDTGVAIDVYIMTEMSYSVSEVGEQVQKKVMSAVEAAVGATVKAVNVHICGVALKKKEK